MCNLRGRAAGNRFDVAWSILSSHNSFLHRGVSTMDEDVWVLVVSAIGLGLMFGMLLYGG
jgi:hypothetical protein